MLARGMLLAVPRLEEIPRKGELFSSQGSNEQGLKAIGSLVLELLCCTVWVWVEGHYNKSR